MTDIPEIHSLTLSWGNTPARAYACGEGPLVVLLHGMGGAADHWNFTLPKLALAGYRAIALDLPGHGGSALPLSTTLTPVWMGQRLADWLHAQAQPAILVGNSLGGWVALHTCLTAPEVVRGLVLVAAAGLEGIATRPPRLRLGGGKNLLRSLLALLFADPGRVSAAVTQRLLMQGMMAPALAALRPEGLLQPADLARILTPTLVVWGAQDGVIPAAWAEVFARSLPRAQLRQLDPCGHLPQIECPVEFHQLLIKFLEPLHPSLVCAKPE